MGMCEDTAAYACLPSHILMTLQDGKTAHAGGF